MLGCPPPYGPLPLPELPALLKEQQVCPQSRWPPHTELSTAGAQATLRTGRPQSYPGRPALAEGMRVVSSSCESWAGGAAGSAGVPPASSDASEITENALAERNPTRTGCRVTPGLGRFTIDCSHVFRSRHAGRDPASRGRQGGRRDSRLRGNDGQRHTIVICSSPTYTATSHGELL